MRAEDDTSAGSDAAGIAKPELVSYCGQKYLLIRLTKYVGHLQRTWLNFAQLESRRSREILVSAQKAFTIEPG